MSNRPKIAAIVPAAGRSTRMGDVKQLLPIDGVPMALHVARRLLQGGCSQVVVVTRSELVVKFGAPPAGVSLAVNDDAKAEMIDSVRIGLRYWQRCAAEKWDGFLVCPADAAGVCSDDVQRCLESFAAAPKGVVMATHQGKGGHPIIFAAGLAEVVHSAICDAGLNQLPRVHPELVRRAPCESPGVLSNANRPDDLRSC